MINNKDAAKKMKGRLQREISTTIHLTNRSDYRKNFYNSITKTTISL